MSIYQVNEKGYYGPLEEPISLRCSIQMWKSTWRISQIIEEESFQEEFNKLLSDYVRRPSPLYHAQASIWKIWNYDLLKTGGF